MRLAGSFVDCLSDDTSPRDEYMGSGGLVSRVEERSHSLTRLSTVVDVLWIVSVARAPQPRNGDAIHQMPTVADQGTSIALRAIANPSFVFVADSVSRLMEEPGTSFPLAPAPVSFNPLRVRAEVFDESRNQSQRDSSSRSPPIQGELQWEVRVKATRLAETTIAASTSQSRMLGAILRTAASR
jgi:hypothetical protein